MTGGERPERKDSHQPSDFNGIAPLKAMVQPPSPSSSRCDFSALLLAQGGILPSLHGGLMSEWTARILHISDLHERGPREPEPFRRRRVLGDAWKRNLDALLNDGAIDLVCFTGDIANWGQPDEYGPELGRKELVPAAGAESMRSPNRALVLWLPVMLTVLMGGCSTGARVTTVRALAPLPGADPNARPTAPPELA